MNISAKFALAALLSSVCLAVTTVEASVAMGMTTSATTTFGTLDLDLESCRSSSRVWAKGRSEPWTLRTLNAYQDPGCAERLEHVRPSQLLIARRGDTPGMMHNVGHIPGSEARYPNLGRFSTPEKHQPCMSLKRL